MPAVWQAFDNTVCPSAARPVQQCQKWRKGGTGYVSGGAFCGGHHKVVIEIGVVRHIMARLQPLALMPLRTTLKISAAPRIR